VVGLTEQDPLLALGVVPVTTTEWFGGYAGAVWPWAQDELAALDADPPEVLDSTDGYNFEAIAAAQPDLILGLYAGMTEEDYATLSAIAPTVAQPGDYVDFGISWQEQTLTIGRIVGRYAHAEALVASVEEQFAAAAAAHPEFTGASAVMATPYEGIFVYAPEDPRGQFLSTLGFELPPDLQALATDQYGFDLSRERTELLDVDAIVWLDVPPDIDDLALALYESLPVHTEGRDVFLSSDRPLGAATSFVTVLSLPLLIDGLVPRLALAVDGDPATVVPPEGEDVELAEDVAAGFPRTVSHGLGEAVIEAKPERIVATADRDQLDVLLAMGVTPVLVGESGDYDEPPPWIDPALLDGTRLAPMADPFTPNLELIAGARPDLIVDAWGGDETQASLEAIAPTVQIKVANETTWQEAQRVAGTATGLEAEAESAIAETEAALAAAAERLTAYRDLVVAVAFPVNGALVILPGDEIGGRIIGELGFEVLDPPEGLSGQFSLEEIDTLLGDADLIVSYGAQDDLESNPLFRRLPAVQGGRYVTVSSEVATAAYQESTLSLRWAANRFADALLTAAEGRGTTL
jgi:iron complex transport system substrate-binding protein